MFWMRPSKQRSEGRRLRRDPYRVCRQMVSAFIFGEEIEIMKSSVSKSTNGLLFTYLVTKSFNLNINNNNQSRKIESVQNLGHRSQMTDGQLFWTICDKFASQRSPTALQRLSKVPVSY